MLVVTQVIMPISGKAKVIKGCLLVKQIKPALQARKKPLLGGA
jgi:hypothetical protein